MIRKVQLKDAAEISKIYNHYITSSIVTFEEEPTTEDEIRERIQSVSTNLPWIVYENNGQVLGYAYASEWKSRCAYKYTVESTIYLSGKVTSKGIGTLLYKDLIQQLTQLKYHTIVGGISLPNPASIALHEKLGFVKVAQFKEVGYKFDQWIDVGYWELIIEG